MTKRKKLVLETAFRSYETREQIGQGGTGRVFRALSDGDTFAVKILTPTGANAERRQRFQNELSFCMRGNHANIVKVLDCGVTTLDGQSAPFYVMPLYPHSLRHAIGESYAQEERLRLFSLLLDGVEAAHLRGVIHRDLKPENVLLDERGGLVVCDFGIARFNPDAAHTNVATRPATRTANWNYAAPEQREVGGEISERTDIFALGLILNELFTGRIPLGSTPIGIATVAPQFAYLDEVVDGMMKQRPTDRPGSIAAIKSDLIGRQKAFVTQQRLDGITGRVVPRSAETDPLTESPPRIVDFDWANGSLSLKLSSPVDEEWVSAFKAPRSHSAVFGAGPEMFTFRGDRAIVAASHDRVQDVIDHFRDWMPHVTAIYRDRRAKARQAAEDAEGARLRADRLELERQIALRNSIRL